MLFTNMCISGNMARRTKSVEELDKKKLWKEKWEESLDGELWTLIVLSSRIGQSHIRVWWPLIRECDCFWHVWMVSKDVRLLLLFLRISEWRILLPLKVIRERSNLAFGQVRCELYVKKNCLLIHIHSLIFLCFL